MLGIEDYGSDDDSDRSDSLQPLQKESTERPSKSVSKVLTSKPQRAPKKIAISLPSISALKDDFEKEAAEDDRPQKRRKIGAGVSSLLSMLPTPKESNPMPPTQRVLGGGSGRALDFAKISSDNSSYSVTVGNEKSYVDEIPISAETTSSTPSTLFRPTSIAKGRSNISVEETSLNRPNQAVLAATTKSLAPSRPPAASSDFFSFSSLTSSSSSSIPSTTNSDSVSASKHSLLGTLSAAPALPTFEPPEPTPTDQYPGYYQLPSGAWAAYDVEYYGKFMKKWEKEYNAHVRALEKGVIKGFEDLQNADVEEIDALKEMEKAKKEIRDREEKKAITQGADGGPVAPKMNINASKLSGVARSRHQLSTLLKEAYENREALEERIAQGKRNRKEAGNKYGF